MKHALWSIWKERGVQSKYDIWWCVQFPNGILSLKRKSEAVAMAATFKRGFEDRQKALR